MDAGARHAFAPSPEPTEGVVHRVRIVFQASDGRVWSAGTDMMAPTIDSADCSSPKHLGHVLVFSNG